MKEIVFDGNKEMPTEYVNIEAKFDCPRYNLSKVEIFTPKITKTIYEDKKYLYAKWNWKEAFVKEHLPFVVVFTCYISRKTYKTKILLMKAVKGEKYSDGSLEISNAKLEHPITSEYLKEMKAKYLSEGYTISKGWELHNLIAYILLNNVSYYLEKYVAEASRVKTEKTIEQVVELAKGLSDEEIKLLISELEKILEERKLSPRVISL